MCVCCKCIREFSAEGVSDKDLLLLDKSRVPKNVIRNTISQYYPSLTYKDLMKNSLGKYEDIHIFMRNVDKLELHHIVPLGDLALSIKAARNNKAHILNSPLNFLYITPTSNKAILSNSVSTYLQYCQD